jgi:hypothetical protein
MKDNLSPVAWYVPYLMTFKGKRTSCPDSLIPELEGTVAWGVELYYDGESVTDKFGIEHKARPLTFGDSDHLKDTVRLNFIEKIVKDEGYLYLHNNKPRYELSGLHIFNSLRKSLDDLAERREDSK